MFSISAGARRENGRASGWTHLPSGPRKPVDHQLSSSAISDGVTRWLWPLIELSPGRTVAFSTFDMWSNSETTTVFQVTGDTTITYRGGPVAAWIVRQLSGGPRFVRLQWIDKGTRRVLQTHDRLATTPETDGSWTVVK